MKMLSQFLVLLLMVDAGWVAYGLAQNRVMWAWIVTYWILLTLKNLCDYLAGRAKKE